MSETNSSKSFVSSFPFPNERILAEETKNLQKGTKNRLNIPPLDFSKLKQENEKMIGILRDYSSANKDLNPNKKQSVRRGCLN